MSKGIALSVSASVLFAVMYYYTSLLTPLSGVEIFGWRMLLTVPCMTVFMVVSGEWRRVWELLRVLAAKPKLIAGVLVWWLAALAGGAESYANFQEIMGSVPGMIVLVGLSWAFFSHMSSGLRHFVLDTGAGYELKTNRLWSTLVFVGAILATAATWLYIMKEALNG